MFNRYLDNYLNLFCRHCEMNVSRTVIFNEKEKSDLILSGSACFDVES